MTEWECSSWWPEIFTTKIHPNLVTWHAFTPVSKNIATSIKLSWTLLSIELWIRQFQVITNTEKQEKNLPSRPTWILMLPCSNCTHRKQNYLQQCKMKQVVLVRFVFFNTKHCILTTLACGPWVCKCLGVKVCLWSARPLKHLEWKAHKKSASPNKFRYLNNKICHVKNRKM